ncbi:T9SS type A sorting domain-containing protein [candidate division KSB1 bacterium]|nr:T9SS type A sorting domain-containing protein [candidate division KSB1 bacterium]
MVRSSFQSTDGGESWTTINTGLTNHSISSLLMSMDSHLFAGTHGNAVFRSAESVTSVKAVNKNELQSFVLEQNYPNPFNPSTEIRFELPVERHVNLIIYNVLGRKIKTLVDEVKEAGSHSVTWDGTDENGQPVPSGVYFYRFDAGMVSGTKKMILMR